MFRILMATLALLSLTAGGPGRAEAAPHGDAGQPVIVTAALVPDGVRVRYRLPEPVTSLTFADGTTPREAWTVLTPGLRLSEGRISADAPFQTVEIAIRPDTAERDRIYMGLSRIGRGYILYGPALRLEQAATELAFVLADGQTVSPAVGAIDGYAYLGPADQTSTDGAALFVSGDNVPPELEGPMRGAFNAAIAFYGDRLRLALPYPPTLAVSVDSPGPAQFRGDVTDTGVISTRFRGDAWRAAEDALVAFVWHEAFHLWNGHGVRAIDAESAPWLHEGGAEYAALVGAASTGALSEDVVRERLSGHLNQCRSTLDDRPFDPARLRSGSAPYACGAIAQWLTDLELRAAGAGDVLGVWRDTLVRARATGGYGVADFRAGLTATAGLAALFDDPGETRWRTVEARLAALGVTLENRPSAKDLMTAALFHVAQRNCRSGSYGFFDEPGALRLDGADCGVLSGEPVIATVEEFDPQAEGPAMFAAVQTRCGAGLLVRYRTRDDRVLEAPCDAPLAEPRVWAISSAPSVALSEPR